VVRNGWRRANVRIRDVLAHAEALSLVELANRSLYWRRLAVTRTESSTGATLLIVTRIDGAPAETSARNRRER